MRFKKTVTFSRNSRKINEKIVHKRNGMYLYKIFYLYVIEIIENVHLLTRTLKLEICQSDRKNIYGIS